ncbi:hypothetical protein AB0G20_37880 [Streptomyces sp. NPDC024017]|uniref:hypothetical protein n=1 Tax=Streptomyces sp. NPDC024017 TaxID=3154326 RepID=UPI0033EBFE03
MFHGDDAGHTEKYRFDSTSYMQAGLIRNGCPSGTRIPRPHQLGEWGLVDDLPPSPAQVPRRLLADPTFVRALHERDFTTVFAMAHDVGISFNRIAEACTLKSERVSQIARGTAAVTALATVERIASGLRIPGALLGLAAQPWEDTSAHSTESDHGEDDPMKRRNLLRGAMAAGLTAPALAALTAARTDVDQTLSPDIPQDLADLEAAAESCGYGYHGQAPTRVLADLTGEVDSAVGQWRPSSGGRRRSSHPAGQCGRAAALQAVGGAVACVFFAATKVEPEPGLVGRATAAGVARSAGVGERHAPTATSRAQGRPSRRRAAMKHRPRPRRRCPATAAGQLPLSDSGGSITK